LDRGRGLISRPPLAGGFCPGAELAGANWKIFWKKLLTNPSLCAIISIESEVNIMVEIIDFVLANAESIVSYEVVDYSMDATIVEFTMVNGEKIQKDF
jgi:hypothetical protein